MEFDPATNYVNDTVYISDFPTVVHATAEIIGLMWRNVALGYRNLMLRPTFFSENVII